MKFVVECRVEYFDDSSEKKYAVDVSKYSSMKSV
jgi:hypothetical protein